MDTADQIWNRATAMSLEPTAAPGDRALHDALSFHSLAMNGGVLHAYDSLEAEGFSRAADGFAWLGMAAAASFLRRAADAFAATDWDDETAVETLEVSTDDEYNAIVPFDQTIEDAFRQSLSADPGAFAALS